MSCEAQRITTVAFRNLFDIEPRSISRVSPINKIAMLSGVKPLEAGNSLCQPDIILYSRDGVHAG
jgi:hypothetical protein